MRTGFEVRQGRGRLAKDRDACWAFYDFPAEHWAALPLQSPGLPSAGATVSVCGSYRTNDCLARDNLGHRLQTYAFLQPENWRQSTRGSPEPPPSFDQTWSWDITNSTKWTYFYLYVVLDIFSRYAVGWMVADRENSALAGRLIEETCHKQGVQPQVLTLHSDRGAPMTSKCTAQLLADLGVTRSLSRPQVSDDNPFSEAQFKTLKYHPGFPGRFHDITAAIAFCRTFFPWYNTEHRHGGIAMLTPDDVHHNRTQSVLEQRGRTLQAAWTRHPERFVRGIPQPDPLPQAVWINPPVTPTTGETAQ